ncbi:MAG: glycoside hydrolase [Planctomycetota bacterium]|nr:glycoside hydrolase [Planctomycetota bacterium]
MTRWILAATFALAAASAAAQEGAEPVPQALDDFLAGRFAWKASPPLISPARRDADPCHAIKDPTVVFSGGKWHVFATIRSRKRSHQIEYLSFADWKDADKAERYTLDGINDAFYCAPQVFYFTPHKKWYLIYQGANEPKGKKYAPCFSTTENIADPRSWTPMEAMIPEKPKSVDKMWLDFWVICDAKKAYLFFTSCDGRFWRAETALADFPKGWSEPKVVLSGDIFEASHTYKVKGRELYLTLIECQDSPRRYFKAFVADALDGTWKPLAASKQQPFAGKANIVEPGGHWTDSVSHGELLREGCDERFEIDPAHLRFLFQGVTQEEMQGRKYGEIPWRLGLLEPK